MLICPSRFDRGRARDSRMPFPHQLRGVRPVCVPDMPAMAEKLRWSFEYRVARDNWQYHRKKPALLQFACQIIRLSSKDITYRLEDLQWP